MKERPVIIVTGKVPNMERLTMFGSGFSAVCPSASIGCAFGSCRAAAPLVAESLFSRSALFWAV